MFKISGATLAVVCASSITAMAVSFDGGGSQYDGAQSRADEERIRQHLAELDRLRAQTASSQEQLAQPTAGPVVRFDEVVLSQDDSLAAQNLTTANVVADALVPVAGPSLVSNTIGGSPQLGEAQVAQTPIPAAGILLLGGLAGLGLMRRKARR